MSDISLGPGFGVVVGGVFALAVGLGLLVLAMLTGVIFVRQGSWRTRVFRFVVGPLVCLGVTVAYLVVAEFMGKPAISWLGEQYQTIPFVALGIAVVTTLAYELRRSRRRSDAG